MQFLSSLIRRTNRSMEEQNFTDYFPQTALTDSEPANATETFMESSTMNLGSNEVNGMKLLLESTDEIGVRLEFDGDETGARLESDGDEHGMMEYEENGSRAAKEGLKVTGRDIVVFGNNNGSATRPIILDSNNTNSKGKGKKIEHDDADSIAIIPNQSTLSHLSPETLPKRKRGRPIGSSNKLKPFASTVSAGGFPVYPALGELMPHILTVERGENILSQLLLLSQSTNRAMCILSAVGVVSIVCIRKLSGSYLRFKGSFQILSLSGTFVYGSTRNPLEKSWMINVLLANHDGKAFGGSVAGFMIAAEPVQIVVGSFEQGTRKERKKSRRAGSSSSSRVPGNAGITRATPLIMIPPKAKNDEICTSPASALLANSGSGHLIGANSINPASLPSFGQNVDPASLLGFGQNVNSASPPDFGQNVNPASPPAFNLKFNPASLPGFGQNVPQSMLGPGTSIDIIPFVP